MIVAITTRITKASNYDEYRDAISHDLIKNISKQKFTPLLIPNCNSNPNETFEKIPFNCLVLSGGDDIYSEDLDDKDKYKETKLKRDITEKRYIDFCCKRNIPIIGICRGMQLLNIFFGGTLVNSKNSEHIQKSHLVFGINEYHEFFPLSKFVVNSYHKFTITNECVSKEFSPLMVANDGTIECFIHNNQPIFGLMWHPERKFEMDMINNFFKNEFFQNIILRLVKQK